MRNGDEFVGLMCQDYFVVHMCGTIVVSRTPQPQPPSYSNTRDVMCWGENYRLPSHVTAQAFEKNYVQRMKFWPFYMPMQDGVPTDVGEDVACRVVSLLRLIVAGCNCNTDSILVS